MDRNDLIRIIQDSIRPSLIGKRVRRGDTSTYLCDAGKYIIIDVSVSISDEYGDYYCNTVIEISVLSQTSTGKMKKWTTMTI